MDNVEWPSTPIPEPIKKTIARFYELVDSLEHSQQVVLAREVFTEDGKFVVNNHEMCGPDEIENWSTGFANLVYFAHVVEKVYTCNDKGDDVLMTGIVKQRTKNASAQAPYCARCVVDDAGSERPRIRLWQGWFDSVPFLPLRSE